MISPVSETGRENLVNVLVANKCCLAWRLSQRRHYFAAIMRIHPFFGTDRRIVCRDIAFPVRVHEYAPLPDQANKMKKTCLHANFT